MCDCIKAVNERLEFGNAKIARGFTFEFESGKNPSMNLSPPMIELEKIDKKRRGKMPILLATCCPFCGERYPT